MSEYLGLVMVLDTVIQANICIPCAINKPSLRSLVAALQIPLAVLRWAVCARLFRPDLFNRRLHVGVLPAIWEIAVPITRGRLEEQSSVDCGVTTDSASLESVDHI